MTRPRSTDPALEADLARAIGLHRSGHLSEAEAIYRRILARSPRHAHTLNYLGTLLAASGRAEEGLDLLKRSVREAPQVPELHLNLGDALAASGRLEAAESALKRALQQRRSPEALAKLGVVLLRQGKMQPAAHQLEQALKLAPESVDIRCNLAVIRAQQDEAPAARRLLAGAMALAPAHLDALNATAALDQQQGRLAEAAGWLRRTLAVAHAFAPAHANLGMTLDQLGDRTAAARHDRTALALSPGDPNAWGNFGNLIQGQGRPTEAEAALRRATRLQPGNATAWSNLGRTLNAQGRFVDAVAAYRRALELDPHHAPARSNLIFLSHFDPSFTPERIFAEHVAFGQVHEPELSRQRRPHANPREPERRLRLGYVSADLGRHPVGYFLAPVLPRHDPAAVEVVCYSDRAVEDDMTALFRSASSEFNRISGLSDDALAEMIRRDRIDVLVDLAGHTAGNRLLAFARKPAPVQVTWLGYYDTTGLTTIDAVLADPWEVEPGDERWYVEKVVRLPTGRLCYGPPADAPKVSAPPAAAAGRISFGSFNHVAKLTDATLAAWGRILSAVPDARMVLRSPPLADATYRDRLAQRSRRLGLDPARLDMGTATQRGILEAYGEIDLALDPFPFPGGLTTCESLWMGVPVVTLRGGHPVTRQSVSFLSRVGLPQLIADSVDDYVALALSLAQSPGRLAEMRRELRPRMAASSLTDGVAAARAVEAAIRGLWRSWCGGAKPSPSKA